MKAMEMRIREDSIIICAAVFGYSSYMLGKKTESDEEE